MTKKAELVEEAEALGIDTDGLKVAELEAAIGEAQASQTDEAPAPQAGDVNTLADVVATIEGNQVRLGFGEWSGAEFSERDAHLISHDEAVALADALPDLARAALSSHP